MEKIGLKKQIREEKPDNEFFANNAIRASQIIGGEKNEFFKVDLHDKIYLIGPWVDKDFVDAILEIRKKDFKERSQYALSLIRQVMALHKKNLIHGDIKPDNIMYNSASGDCLLMDLDSVTEPGKQHARCSFTSSYLDRGLLLEHARLLENGNISTQLSFHDDIYALGIVLLEIFPELGMNRQEEQRLNRRVLSHYVSKVDTHLDMDAIPEESRKAAENLRTLLARMTDQNRTKRPNFRDWEEIYPDFSFKWTVSSKKIYARPVLFSSMAIIFTLFSFKIISALPALLTLGVFSLFLLFLFLPKMEYKKRLIFPTFLLFFVGILIALSSLSLLVGITLILRSLSVYSTLGITAFFGLLTVVSAFSFLPRERNMLLGLFAIGIWATSMTGLLIFVPGSPVLLESAEQIGALVSTLFGSALLSVPMVFQYAVHGSSTTYPIKPTSEDPFGFKPLLDNTSNSFIPLSPAATFKGRNEHSLSTSRSGYRPSFDLDFSAAKSNSSVLPQARIS